MMFSSHLEKPDQVLSERSHSFSSSLAFHLHPLRFVHSHEFIDFIFLPTEVREDPIFTALRRMASR